MIEWPVITRSWSSMGLVQQQVSAYRWFDHDSRRPPPGRRRAVPARRVIGLRATTAGSPSGVGSRPGCRARRSERAVAGWASIPAIRPAEPSRSGLPPSTRTQPVRPLRTLRFGPHVTAPEPAGRGARSARDGCCHEPHAGLPGSAQRGPNADSQPVTLHQIRSGHALGVAGVPLGEAVDLLRVVEGIVVGQDCSQPAVTGAQVPVVRAQVLSRRQ
jgi:hypothetical protein